MKRKKKGPIRSKKRLNLFTSLLLLIIISAGSLFLAQQLTTRQIINSNAQTTCSTPGGCGGNCNPNQNNGCGYGGCRYWEYCADENNDGIPSCYDTTALGTKLPDYSRACGTEKANQTSGGNSTIPTTKPATNSNNPTNTPAPAQNSICNNPQGCGGNCNPNQNTGCGYGGCRFWEYCGDDNRDGVYSCYDTTNLGTKEPDYSRACGAEKTSISQPTPTQVPVFTLTPTVNKTNTPTPINSNTPTPRITGNEIDPTSTPTTAAQVTPSNTVIPTTPQPTTIAESAGNYDMSKLCIPLEVHASGGDKLDIVILPMGYSKEQAQSGFYQLAKIGVDSLKQTNLSKYPNETLNKMNWYILNVFHPDFKSSVNPNETIDGFGAAMNFGAAANYCGRDIFMMVLNDPSKMNGMAQFGTGALVYSGSLVADGGKSFAHEWGHAAVNLRDEIPSTNNSHGLNCTNVPAAGTSTRDPCPVVDPELSGAANAYICGNTINDPAYQKPCPQWDCNVIDCSPLARDLLKDSGCYPRCGTVNSYRPAANSIMANPWSTYKPLDFNGPSLVNIIEVIFSKYN